jgi:hypothetical protein
LHAHERRHAQIAASYLEDYEAGGQHIEARAAVALNVESGEIQLRQFGNHIVGELRTLPVAVDDRRDLRVHESTDAGLQRTLLVSEQVTQVIVVRVLGSTQNRRLDVRRLDSIRDR